MFKKIIIFISVLISASSFLYAENKNAGSDPAWIYKGKFDEGMDFKDGLARIQNGFNERALYGFINESGKLIAPIKYHSATEFENGYARVGLKSGMGLINRDGRIVLQLKYTEAIYADIEDRAIVADKNFIYALVDFSGKEITPFKYQEIKKFSNGLAAVKYQSRYGFIDTSGNEVIPCTYHNAESFSEGLARVQKNGRTGYIDTTGKEVIPLIYDSGERIKDGIIFVTKDNKEGGLDKKGNIIIPFLYTGISDFKEGLARVAIKKNGSKFVFGYINNKGKEIIPPVYDEAAYTFSEGLAYVKQNGLFGYIDRENRVIIPFKYTHALNFTGGLARVKKSADLLRADTAYIDKTGREITDFRYKSAGEFIDGIASVSDGQNYGYIDTNGKEITPMIYDNGSTDFSEGYAFVKNRKECGFIDRSGKLVINIKHKTGCSGRNFKNGFAYLFVDISTSGYIKKPAGK